MSVAWLIASIFLALIVLVIVIALLAMWGNRE
jgi:hypothetical protein